MKKIKFIVDWQGYKKDDVLETKIEVANQIIKLDVAKAYEKRKTKQKKED